MTDQSGNLDRTFLRGLSWNVAGRWAGQAASWASTLVVVRLLTPADYGLVAMGGTLFSLVGVLADGGIRGAIVNRRESDPNRLRQLMVCCVLVGVGMTLFAMAMAIPLARFFNEPRLVAVVLVTSISYTVLGFRMVPLATLQRDLNYRTMASNDFVWVLVTAMASVIIAALGGGYWALILAHLIGTSVAALLAWRAAPIGFAKPIWTEVSETVRFGVNMLLAQVAGWVGGNADGVVIGRFVGRAPLGAYKVAMEMASIPLEKVGGILVQVTGPIFAAVQADRIAMARYLLLITEALATVVWPLAIGLALTADLVVAVLLGPQWAAAVLPLRVFAIGALVRAISSPITNVMLACHQSAMMARVSFVTTALVVTAMIPAARWGVIGVMIVWAIGQPMGIALPLRTALRETLLTPRQYCRVLLPATLGCCALMAAVWGTRTLTESVLSPPMQLASSMAAGGAAYAALLALTSGRRLLQVAHALRG